MYNNAPDDDSKLSDLDWKNKNRLKMEKISSR